MVSDGLSGDEGEFGGEEGRDADTDITPSHRAKCGSDPELCNTPGDPGAKTWHHGEERKTRSGVRSKPGSEAHSRELSLELFLSVQQWPLPALVRTSAVLPFPASLPALFGMPQQWPGFAEHRPPFSKAKARPWEEIVCGMHSSTHWDPKIGLRRGFVELGPSSWVEPARCCLLGLHSLDCGCSFAVSEPSLSSPLSLSSQPRISTVPQDRIRVPALLLP